jgi:glycosyltransferase involved in cell wall biosynthesis
MGEVAEFLHKYFRELGEESYVFTSGHDHPNYPYTIRIPTGKKRFLPESLNYYKNHLHNEKFDILNIHGESGFGLTPFLLNKHKRYPKVITTIHTPYIPEAKAIKTLRVNGKAIARPKWNELSSKYIFHSFQYLGAFADVQVSDRVYTVCEQSRLDLMKELFIPGRKIGMIYNGVDLDEFNPKISGDWVRDKHGLGDAPIVFNVGSFHIRKGIHYLIYAMQKVVKDVPDVKLVIAGSKDIYDQELRNLTKLLNLSEHVIFAGYVPNDELPHYYAAADVVAVPSLQESFPIVVLEAMASGKAVVASRVGGIPEAIEEGVNGFLFENENVDELSFGIIRILQNRNLGKSMGSEGRRRAEERHNWRDIARQYLSEFERLITEDNTHKG